MSRITECNYPLIVSSRLITRTGWPVWDVDSADALKSPCVPVEHNWSIGGLENDTTYYIALRAFDDGGKFSPLSAVRSVVQGYFFGLQLTGETGGFWID